MSDNDMVGDQDVEEVNPNDSDDKDMYNDFTEGGWISWFCQLEGNEFFVEVDEAFINNSMNLYGLENIVKNYKTYIEIILSPDSPSENILQNEEYIDNLQHCREVYGLLHARFIATSQGLALVREKYLNAVYGHCPRILCEKQFLLPIGLSEELKYSRVKVYCPRCEEIYKPRQKCSDIDGAFFGLSFPQLFLMTYPSLHPRSGFKQFEQKLYGFRLYGKKGSKYHLPDEGNEKKK